MILHYSMRLNRRSTALIIPALNEEDALGAMLREIPAGLFDTIIVADNGSADRTADIARGHGAVVVNEPERGYGAACQRAIRELPPMCEAIVFMQADASEDAREANRLLAPIWEGRADLVIGSRTLGHAEPGALSPHQEFGNRVACALVRWMYGFRYTDLGPFRAIRTEALLRLGMKDRNYGWTIEMQVRALQQGLRILEVPVSYRVRTAGENKISGNWTASLRAGWKIVWTIFKLSVLRLA